MLNLISALQERRMALSQIAGWRTVFDGFGERAGRSVRIAGVMCPSCGEILPIVKRVLDSASYSLPDAAIYHRLLSGSPCIALGVVDPKRTTLRRKPSRVIRKRWQGMLWHVYRVAFLDLVDNEVGPFEPDNDWGIGRPPVLLESIADRLQTVLRSAWAHGTIPAYNSNGRGDSRETEKRLEPLVSRVLEPSGYCFVGRDRQTGIIDAFWWGHYVDLLYRRADGQSLSVEVKVTENWAHPVNEPLGALLRDNAVLNIRIGTQGDNLSTATKRLVLEAENLLSSTGRAGFLRIS